ncbi:hypothetical protein [Schaalia suimastitidis]|uniref:hypothetical protein n=1 Tax=Schaalia suimastitidis TaxID=121163 RepID=UPI00103BB8C9|nr:hypothetical protein [Schaalia suimastitidis]
MNRTLTWSIGSVHPVATMTTSLRSTEAIALATNVLPRLKYQLEKVQIQHVLNERAANWQCVSYARGRGFGPRELLASMARDVVPFYVPGVSQYDGEQRLVVAARDREQGSEIFVAELGVSPRFAARFVAVATETIIDAIAQCGATVSEPIALAPQQVDGSWPVSYRTFITLQQEAKKRGAGR